MAPQWNKEGKEYVVVKTFSIYFNNTVIIVTILKEKKTLKTEMLSQDEQKSLEQGKIKSISA